MNWYIGQDIVAIRNHSQGKFKEGDVFIIKGLKDSICKCHDVVIDIGVKVNSQIANCPCCGLVPIREDGIHWFSEVSFRPLDTLADISELTEVLNQPAFNV